MTHGHELSQEQIRVMKRLVFLGVGRASQADTTDELLESLQSAGLTEPRRWHDPSVRLWQPTQRGDQLVARIRLDEVSP